MPAPAAHPLSRARAGIILVLLLPFTTPLTGVMSERVLASGAMHVAIVSAMAVISMLVALIASHAAWTRFDVRNALVASGFTAISGLLLVHGLATPGGPFFAQFVSTVEIAGVFALPIGALFLAAAMLRPARARDGRRQVVRVQAATLGAIAAFAGVGLGLPQLLPSTPLMVAPMSWIVLAPTLLVFGWAALHAHRVADMTRRSGDASMFAGIVVLAAAVVIYVTSTPFDAQFWFGHVLELVGLTCIGAGVAADLRRPVSAWRLTEQVEGREQLTSSEELLGGYVHALTVTLSQLDPSTWNHSRRVADLAVAVGSELGLEPRTIRRLAVAGLVHDIGKLRIPHDVLHKPGKLTDEEFAQVRNHPDYGVELLAHLKGFDAELPIVRGHHEKLSGRGYPQGLSAEQICVETRIMTACDVYDALTDARSYKEPWPIERALAMLHEESGEAFDGAVVAALEQVVLRRAAAAIAADAPAAILDQQMAPMLASPPIDLPEGLAEVIDLSRWRGAPGDADRSTEDRRAA